MSTDDIVFDEVKYREPRKLRRPDRDRRFACLAYELPRPEDLPIFIDRKTADAIERHALRDTSVELGGIMLGQECVDDQTGEPFVWVTESLEAKHYENTQASFTYTHDSWEEISRERDKLHPDLDIVGWYHTHPDFGIFLSSHDLFIHRNFFDQPLQVAYVVDPIRQTRGFFRWRDGGLDQVGGYYVSADRGDRIALARLVNDLESLPNADPGGGGGGLSPRLEAELVNMLARPYQAAPTSADRAQLAAMFGTLGLFAGVILVGVAAWIYTLTQQMAAQAETLAKIQKAAEDTGVLQQAALETVLARERDPEVSSSKKFLENLRKDRKNFEEARAEADDQKRFARVVAADNKALEKELLREKEAREKDLKDLESAKLAKEARQEELNRKEDELKAVYKMPQGELAKKYSTTLYAAIAGWIVALLASLGLLALWLSKSPIDAETSPGLGSLKVPVPGVSPEPPPAEDPPHQIL